LKVIKTKITQHSRSLFTAGVLNRRAKNFKAYRQKSQGMKMVIEKKKPFWSTIRIRIRIEA
jgi:hypothetical protein